MDLTDLQITSRDNTIAYLTTRAEQAAKDAVEMAKEVQQYMRLFYYERSRSDYADSPDWKKAQAIIDTYKETT